MWCMRNASDVIYKIIGIPGRVGKGTKWPHFWPRVSHRDETGWHFHIVHKNKTKQESSIIRKMLYSHKNHCSQMAPNVHVCFQYNLFWCTGIWFWDFFLCDINSWIGFHSEKTIILSELSMRLRYNLVVHTRTWYMRKLGSYSHIMYNFWLQDTQVSVIRTFIDIRKTLL